MKLRKILATVVAGAIAASTMITAASAAETTITREVNNKVTGTKAVFSYKLDTSAVRFNANAMTVNTPVYAEDESKVAMDAITMPASPTGAYYAGYDWQIESVKINGKKATIDQTDGSLIAKEVEFFSTNALSLKANIIPSFEVEVVAALASLGGLGTPDYELTKDYIDDLDGAGASTTLSFTAVRTPNAKGEYDLGTVGTPNVIAPPAANPVVPIDLAISSSAVDELANGAGARATYNWTNFKFTVAERAQLKNATSATFSANLQNVTRQDSYAIVSVLAGDVDQKMTASIVKGKTATVEVDIPMDFIYRADYDEFFEYIRLELVNVDGGTAKILDGTLTFVVDDGAEVVAPDVDEDDAEDDFDDDDIEDGDEDIIDNTTDDDDIEDGDDDMDYDDDNTDGTDVETTDVPKTGVALAIVPAAIAAAAVVIARKRK